jgi:hypothetical protein
MLVACNFLLSSCFFVIWKSWDREQQIVREAHLAIEAFEVTTGAMPPTQVSHLTLDDLAKNAALSPDSRRWLRDSKIVVRRDLVRPGELPPSIRWRWPYETAFTSPNRPGSTAVAYSATIQTASGTTCDLRYWTAPPSDFGLLIESCR